MNQDLLYRATALCASSEHCCHDLREKLRRWGATEMESEEIMDYLISEKYIDEERFCRAYAKDKMRYNHWGRLKIDQGMRMLGLDAAWRRQALSELPEEEYLDILTRLLQSKARSVKAKNAYDRQAKLMRFALGRGFESSLIRDCMPEEETDEDEACPDDFDRQPFPDEDDSAYDPRHDEEDW